MVNSDSKKGSKQPFGEKEQLELIISALNTGLALIDPDMTLVWANNIIKKLFPYANLDGQKCFAVAENRTMPCDNCQAILAFKDGEIHEREFQNKQNKRWYKVVSLPVKNQEGHVIYVLEASSDITDRKQAEKEHLYSRPKPPGVSGPLSRFQGSVSLIGRCLATAGWPRR